MIIRSSEMSNATLYVENVISFGLSLSASGVSLCGCVATFYMVSHFQSSLSWALLLMNVTSMLGSAMSAIMAFQFPDSHGPIQFFASLFGNSSIIFFMYQIMYRSWMLPTKNIRWDIFQWVLFGMSSLLMMITIIFSIPTDMNNIVYGGDAFSILLGVGGGITLILDIVNSIYVVIIVTQNKFHLDRTSNYRDFMKRRLPILVINVVLGTFAIIFVLSGYPNSYDVVNFVVAFITFLSIYYYSDLKDFIYKQTSTHDRHISNSDNHDRYISNSDRNISSQEVVVFDMSGNITITT